MEFTSFIALVTALTQMFKVTFKISDRFKPIMAVMLGIFIVWLFADEAGVKEVLLTGIVSGLASAGLYDVTKITLLGKYAKK